MSSDHRTAVERLNDREAWNAAIARVAARKHDWPRVSIAERCAYLESAIKTTFAASEGWVEAACRARGVDPTSSLAGEEWVAGPAVTLRQMRLYLRALRSGGRPRFAGRVSDHPDGARVPVFPLDLADRILYLGMRAEVRLLPGAPPTQGEIYRRKERGEDVEGRVALVLGAGNISSIPPLDILYKLFVEDQVVVVKMNPVNEYVGPFLERAFAELVRDGYLSFAYGGVDAGRYLCADERVDTLHLTGSDKTYDAIVWGGDPLERSRRKAERAPQIDKPFSAELGCVTPVVVVPGEWSDADLRYQARHVAAMVAHNASFNCNAAKVVVTARRWDRRDRFLEAVRDALRTTPERRAYYPGAHERYRAFLDRYSGAEPLGPAGEDTVPWTFIPDVPARQGEYALSEEAFCGVLAEVAVDGDDAPSFLSNAVSLCNESIWGTLSCVVLVDGATQRRHATAVDSAIDALRYGGIGVNVWAGVVYGIGNTTWGAYPGHTPDHIVSGVGVVHNALWLDHPCKSVLYAPFRMWPTPVYFPGHRTLRTVGRQLTRFSATRSPVALAALLIAGIGG